MGADTGSPSETGPGTSPTTGPATGRATNPATGEPHRSERRARPRGTELLDHAATASHVPDEVLIRQAGLGDKTAFAQLITRHGPNLYRYVYRLLNDRGDAEDCVQNVLLSAWRGLASFRGDSSVRTWLLVMGRHEALKLLQQQRPHFPQSGSRPSTDLRSTLDRSTDLDDVAAGLPDERFDPARDAIDTQLLHALDAALMSLPERQRSVWILREVEDLSYTDIATAISVTPGAVRGLLHRARTTIAEALEEWR